VLEDDVNSTELDELELELDELFHPIIQSGGPLGCLPRISSCMVHSNRECPVG